MRALCLQQRREASESQGTGPTVSSDGLAEGAKEAPSLSITLDPSGTAPPEALARVEKLKEAGNAAFHGKDFAAAKEKYTLVSRPSTPHLVAALFPQCFSAEALRWAQTQVSACGPVWGLLAWRPREGEPADTEAFTNVCRPLARTKSET